MTRDLTEEEIAFYAHVGRWIKQRRRKTKTKAIHLAEQLGVHRNSIMRWEQGRPLSAWQYRQVYELLKPKEAA